MNTAVPEPGHFVLEALVQSMFHARYALEHVPSVHSMRFDYTIYCNHISGSDGS